MDKGESAFKGACLYRGAKPAAARALKLYNIPGNLPSLWRFYHLAVECSFKWSNRRGGKRKSFTWKAFNKAIEQLGIAKPKMQIVNRQHRVFA